MPHNLARPLTSVACSPARPCRQGSQELQLKLFARLRCCCQLEALLDVLLQVGQAAAIDAAAASLPASNSASLGGSAFCGACLK